MSNLYSITTNQEAISRLFRVMNRYVGNLAPMTGVFPDYRPVSAIPRQAPILRPCGGACRRHRAQACHPSPTSATRRLLNTGAVIFIALVVIAVAVMLMA